MCHIISWVYSHLMICCLHILSWAIWSSAQTEREFNSVSFHGSSQRTGLSLVLLPNHFYFPIKLMEYLKFGGQKKMQYVALPFLLQTQHGQLLKRLKQMEMGVYLFSRNVLEKKHLNRSVCWKLKLLPSRATLASSTNASICTQTSALSACDSIRSYSWFE